jgi:uncharacterized membrane protein
MIKLGVEWLGLVLIVAAFTIGIYFYPSLPSQMATHWGMDNQVNGTTPRFWGTFLLPVILTLLWLFLVVIPRMDPKKTNIEKFRKFYYCFVLAIMTFLLYVFGLSIYWNLGHTFQFSQAIAPALSILLFCMGILLAHTEPNFTIGIRTPWTLASDTVWTKTHKLGSLLFKLSALISLPGVLFPSQTFLFIIIPIALSSVATYAYSYLEFRKEANSK